MARADRIFFLVLTCAASVYVMLRATLVPPVHDECASLLWYVRPGEWLPYSAHWDANNHYLNSGIGILLARAFGESLPVLRAGSLLAFGLYAWAVWRTGAHVRGLVVRRCLYAALLLCPFLLDFFSLFRGYAIEMAFWLVALDSFMRYAGSYKTRELLRALLALLVANAAILALVPVWALVLLGFGVLLWVGRQRLVSGSLIPQLGALLLLGALPLYGASILAFELKDRGLLYHGSTEGFFDVTVRSLSNCLLNFPSASGAFSVALVVVSAIGVILVTAVRDRAFTTPAVVLAALFSTDALTRVLLAQFFGVNYPEDRAALHYVPMALIAIALAIDQVAGRWPKAVWAALLLLLLPARTLWTANLDHTLAWREQSVPKHFIETVDALAQSHGRPMLVGAHHQLALAWPMWSYMQGVEPQPLSSEGFPGASDDLRIVDARYAHEAAKGFRAIDSAAGPGLWLLERRPIAHPDTLAVLRAPNASARAEFMELVHVPDSFLWENDIQVQVDVPMIIPSSSPDVRLVLEVNDSRDVKLFYGSVAPMALRPQWTGQNMRWVWGLSAMPEAKRAVIYLHNPGKRVLSHGKVRALVSAIRE